MNKIPKHISLLLVLVVAFSVRAAAYGQGNIRVGNFRIQPGIAYEFEWNDNIFLDESDEEDDCINTLTPSLELDWRKNRDNYVRVGYATDIVRYPAYDGVDYEKHSIGAELQYKSPMGYYFRVRDYFVDTEDPYGSLNEYRRGIPQVERWTNAGAAAIGYDFPNRLRLELTYRSYILDYDAFMDYWQNYTSHEPGLTLFYQLLPKTAALIEYRWETREYTEQQDASDNSYAADSVTAQDFDYHKFFLGLHMDPTAKISGDLKLGLGYRDFANDVSFRTGPDGNPLHYNDTGTWIAETMLHYQVSRRTRLKLGLAREAMDSADIMSTTYDSTAVELGLAQGIGRRLKLFGDVCYEYDDYEGGREDDTYYFSARLQYTAKEWCIFNLYYIFEEEDSSAAGQSYTNNRFGVSAAFKL